VRVENKISEGGFAFVYKVTDVNTFATFALKKIAVTSNEHRVNVENEIKIWKKLGDHENIVKFVDASVIKDNNGTYVLILCELCTQGTLFDLLQKFNGKLSEQQIIFILKEIAKGI